ncbi:beta-1,3-galactosyltransferase 2-like [Astyanax mexicanus]|uniref:beta-1,3-galactosyltransferase 2-like n=1 Tax=Astyanax mexicanus TaxID=7994 RepID=UPI0020CB27DA|nr:beta-1,3-galactosyltransferase 2-like [Astyanax mexicanus]
MALFSCCKFHARSCFMLLLCITFTVSVTYYIQLPNDWISSVSDNIYSYYRNLTVHSPPRPRHMQTTDQRTTADSTPAVMSVTSHANTEVTEGLMSTVAPTPYNAAYPQNYHFILDEPEKCKQENPFLVLMVPVAPHELEARNAIRSTWGNETVVQGKTVTVLFLVGLPGIKAEKQQEELNLESQKYHDLIQSDFMDTYLNLTVKTMVIMDWLATRCPQAAYSMKVDSDMFLNLDNMMNLLLAPETPRINYITGMVMWSQPVIRDPASKWYVPKELYPEDYYPTYLLGMGYIFSNDLPKKLVEVSKDIQPFNIEDAYVGACLKKLGIAPSTPPNPSQFKAYFNGNYQREEFQRVITTILSSPQQLIKFWQDSMRPT